MSESQDRDATGRLVTSHHRDRLEPPRPVPSIGGAGLSDWMRWVGGVRLGVTAGCVAIIAGGLWWLLRAPPLPTEQSLPIASSSVPSSQVLDPTATLHVATSAPPADTAEAAIVVHVAGAVTTPGVYELDDVARVIDAIDAAGGLKSSADTDVINLAAPVTDGARVYIPRRDERTSAPTNSVPPLVDPPPTELSTGEVADAGSTRIDVNTATDAELEELPGIGPATAAAIIEDRARNGPFASVDDLDRVSGIGPAKVEALRDMVTT